MNVQSLDQNVTTLDGVKVRNKFLNAFGSGKVVEVLLVYLADQVPGQYVPPTLALDGESYNFESDGSGPEGVWVRYSRPLSAKK